MTVEATSDGWVVLTSLTYWTEARYDVPTSHLHALPEDVERWTTATRRLLAKPADSLNTGRGDTLPTLGRGRIRLSPYVQRLPRNLATLLQFANCEGVYMSIAFSRPELDSLTSALERASVIARRNAGSPMPPTLDRPYYSSEVSCVARRVSDDSPPHFPSTMPRSMRRYTEVGARFVVDTSGFVEQGSVVLLPGVPSPLERATRKLIQGWRFTPAEWSGLPVRQIVNTVLVFDPDEEATRDDSARVAIARAERSPDLAIRAEASRQRAMLVQRDEGWVRVRTGRWRSDGLFEGYQEWFQPDSVTEWVSRTRGLIAADSAAPKHAPSPRDYPRIFLGSLSRPGNMISVQYQRGPSSDTARLKIVTLMSGCAQGFTVPAPIDRRLLEQLAAAARGARLHRASLPSGARAYARGEVACPSFLQPIGVARPELAWVSRYARGPYPDLLSRQSIRAEVLSSFVVDTAGMVSAATLAVAPGADPRAVAVLRESIERVHFQPARRAGVPVPSRVMRTWLFEPPPTCADERDGIACARVYGKER